MEGAGMSLERVLVCVILAVLAVYLIDHLG